MSPMIVLSRSADALLAPARVFRRRDRGAHRVRGLLSALGRMPAAVLSAVLCAAAWAIFLFRGVGYPLIGGDSHDAWGGPTLAGAWTVHFLGSAATLGVVLVLTGALGKWTRTR